LKNRKFMKRLNPFDEKRRTAELALNKERNSKRAAAIKAKRKDKNAKATRKARNTKYFDV